MGGVGGGGRVRWSALSDGQLGVLEIMRDFNVEDKTANMTMVRFLSQRE